MSIIKKAMRSLLIKSTIVRTLFVLCYEISFFIRLKYWSLFSTKKEAKALNSIYKNGYCVVEDFWDEQKVTDYERIMTKLYDACDEDSYEADKNVYTGSNRFYHIDRDISSLIKDFKENDFILNISRKFNGRLPADRKLMYQHSYHDDRVESYYEDDFKDGDNTPIAPRYHFDFCKRTLKAVVCLTDVDETNGPTKYIKVNFFDIKTIKIWISRFKKQCNYFKNYFLAINNGDSSIYSHEEANYLKLDDCGGYFSGKKGTLILFDTFNLHKAELLKKRDRKILWYYFNS